MKDVYVLCSHFNSYFLLILPFCLLLKASLSKKNYAIYINICVYRCIGPRLEARRGHGSPWSWRLWVTWHGCWELTASLLEEEQGFLTTEPYLLPPKALLYVCFPSLQLVSPPVFHLSHYLLSSSFPAPCLPSVCLIRAPLTWTKAPKYLLIFI